MVLSCQRGCVRPSKVTGRARVRAVGLCRGLEPGRFPRGRGTSTPQCWEKCPRAAQAAGAEKGAGM